MSTTRGQIHTVTTTGTYTIRVIDRREDMNGEVLAFITRFDATFYPPLSSRGSIDAYIDSLFAMNARFIICSNGASLIGLAGICLNHSIWKYSYQYMAVDEAYRLRGVPGILLEEAYRIFREHGAVRFVGRTWSTNAASIQHFRKYGFIHFDTVMDDRGAGIHTFYFTKIIQPLSFGNEVKLLGMIGGMGTFATGNFIRSLSGIPQATPREQDMLSYVVINEATVPDRLSYIREGRTAELTDSLIRALDTINQDRLSHLLVLCFTVHPFIDRLPVQPNVEVINLVTISHVLIGAEPATRWLLVAARGSYSMELMSREQLVYPSAGETDRIHDIIFDIKKGIDPAYYKEEIAAIARNNQCTGLLLGCTDLHGMYGFSQQYEGIRVLDPLAELIFHLHDARKLKL